MKIKIKNRLEVELSTLVRLEFNRFVPTLVVHERFEKYVKWTIRLITLIGIIALVYQKQIHLHHQALLTVILTDFLH